MKLSLLIALLLLLILHTEICSSSTSTSPKITAYQLLSNVQAAIHNKNYNALSNLLTPETYELVVSKMTSLAVPYIAVHDIIEVENVDVDNPPNMRFTAKVGELTSNWNGVYSESEKKYLLNQENCFELIVNKTGLKEEIRKQEEWDALHLIIYIEDAIKIKNRVEFEKWFTPNAKFMTCDGESKDAMMLFDEIKKTPANQLPINEQTEVKNVIISGFDMNFTARIDGRDVYYIAKYSKNLSRWQVEQESCSEYFPALINQTRLAEWMAVETVRRFIEASVMLSPKRLNAIAASQIFVYKCDNGTIRLPGLERFYDFLYSKQFYLLDDEFKVSNVDFNVTSGSLKFVAVMNKLSTNEIQVERSDGEYRLVSMKNLNCLDYSNPDMESHKIHGYLYAMDVAEKLLDRFVNVMRTGNIEDCPSLFTDPYTRSDGTTINHEDWKYFQFSPSYPDVHVMSVEWDGYGLLSFRAEIDNYPRGVQFIVNTFLARKRLESESYYDL